MGTIPVRACLTAAWLSPDHILAAPITNACQSGGDWCIVQPHWLITRLPH
jgi:hypothetical protein